MFNKVLLCLSATLISLNHAFNCCITHTLEAGCAAVADSACEWLVPADPLLTSGTSAGNQCVSVSWAECERTGVCSPPPAVPLPPAVISQCVFETCTSNAVSFNVAIVIDESGSIGQKDYMTSLDFVENMIRNDINAVSKISMLAFASGMDRIYHFADSQDDQKAGALAALDAERSDYNGGMTATATAIGTILDEFEAASDPWEENILILMTDGQPTMGGDPCVHVDRLEERGVEVFVVGVSAAFKKGPVECLVPQDKIDRHILEIPKFKAEHFWQMEAKLRQVVCPIVFEDAIVTLAKMVFGEYGYHNGEFQYFAPLMSMIVFVVLMVVVWKRVYGNNKKGYERLSDNENYGTV